jgi:hypothetical protein
MLSKKEGEQQIKLSFANRWRNLFLLDTWILTIHLLEFQLFKFVMAFNNDRSIQK